MGGEDPHILQGGWMIQGRDQGLSEIPAVEYVGAGNHFRTSAVCRPVCRG